MWDKFNEASINAELHLLDVCPEDGQVAYACVDRNDICVILCDKRTERNELADETPFGGEIPLWFSEVSHRASPVYDLYSVIQGLKQYPAFKNVSSISGILFTTTYIINEEDMEAIWKNMGISVRSVKDMSLTVLPSDSRIWDDVTGYLKQKNNVREFVDLDEYSHMMEEYSDESLEASEPEPDKQCPEKISDVSMRNELRLEDIVDHNDPVFQTLGPDGTSTFVAANLPHLQVWAPMEDASAALDKMVGLDDVKNYLVKMKNLALFNNKLRDFPGVKVPKVSLHSIFAGSPGTGKTTVALMCASLFKEAGILSKGNVLVAQGRNAFLGRWVGTEEKNVRMCLAAAKGNVLVIDEAYTLVTPNELDYSRNVLPMMLALLGDEEYRDISVILCGYTREMDELLKSNPGLRSRFPNYFKFEDYSVAQLFQIIVNRFKDSGYILTDEATEKIKCFLEHMYENRIETQWANGRECSNLYDKIISLHATNCISSGAEGEALITIRPEDIPEIDKDSVRKTRRIGFR